MIENNFLQLNNTCLERMCFSQEWKISTIIPIENVSNTNTSGEYRPINTVATYEKLLDTNVNNEMRRLLGEAIDGIPVRF